MKLLKEWKDESYNKGAIYWIQLKDKSIDRFLGKDKEGILAIGKTKNLRDRIEEFYKAKDNGNLHSEGRTLFLIKEEFEHKFRNQSIYYFYKKVGERELERRESEEIKKYVETFGEVPPLNSAIPKKENWITEKKLKK